MTESEAISAIQNDLKWHSKELKPAYKEALNMAIKALEKQIPYKPQEYEDEYYGCKCGKRLLPKWRACYPAELMPKSEGLPYCMDCGQKLDWE